MLVKQVDLARKLGVSKAAVGQAVKAGSLVRQADGLVDTKDPENAAYLARFTAHRGKQRPRRTPSSPARAAAMLSKVTAKFEKDVSAYNLRIKDTAPRYVLDAIARVYLDSACKSLASVPSRKYVANIIKGCHSDGRRNPCHSEGRSSRSY